MNVRESIGRRATLLVALAGAAAAFWCCVLWVRDPDTFHHLAYGRAIARGGFPVADPFLWPLAGQPMGILPYWLGSLAIYGWHAVFGDGGLAYLPAAAAAATFAVLLADSAPRAGRHTGWTLAAAAPPLVLALESFRFRATARPELFAMIFVAVTAWAARRFEDGRPRLLLAFPLLAALWTNVHPSVAAGLAFVGALAASAALGGAPGRPRAALGAAGVLAAGLLASLATPSADDPVLLGLRFVWSTFAAPAASVGAGESSAAVPMLVAELARPRLGFLATPPGLLLCLTALSFLLRWRAPRARELATVALFAALASRGVRFAAILAVVCAPIAARNLGEALARLPGRLGRLPLRAAAAAAAALAAAVHPALATSPPMVSYGTGLWPPAYPVRAADYLEANRFDGRLYNAFQLGGYLAWRGVPAYQDGRGAVPAGALAASIVGPADPEAFAVLDAAFRFDALLLEFPELPPATAGALQALKGDDDWLAERSRWALVAFDDGGLLYLRRDGRYADLVARDELRLAKPANAGVRLQRSSLPALLAEYARAMRESPSCARCRFLFASFALAGGFAADAERALAPALAADGRRLPELLLLAGRVAEVQRRPELARERYARFLEAGGDDPEARRGLARLALEAGDAAGADRTLRQSLRGEPRDPADLQLAARIALSRGRPDEAAAWRAAGERAERAAVAQGWFERALAAERTGDLPGAIEACRTSLALHESNAPVHSNLGWVLQKAGRPDEAIREHRRAIELDPALASAHYGLGTALAERGDAAGAAAAFRRYLALEPQGRWAIKASELATRLEGR